MKKLMFIVLGSLLLLAWPTLAQDGLAQDPTGSYEFEVPSGWTVTEADGYILVNSPNDEIINVLSVEESDDLHTGLDLLWAKYDPTYDTSVVTDELDVPSDQLNGFEKGIAVYYQNGTGADGVIVAGASYLFEGRTYPSLLLTTLTVLQRRISQMYIFGGSYRPVEENRQQEDAAEVQPWTDDMSAALTDYMEEWMPKLEVPGAALAVVQDGQIVYVQGFGKTDEDGGVVNPDTNFVIASMTKSMTTLLMAQSVDAGLFQWDTPVTEVLPSFAVADPEITQTITMQDLVCACSGVPRRDLELVFNENSAEDVLASLASFEFFTEFGEAFQYSNQLVAAAGYITAVANGAETDELLPGYADLLTTNVFQPLGMNGTSVLFDQVKARGNYAQPYGVGLEAIVPEDVATENWLEAIAPSGGVWSNVNDMARYLIMETNQGELDGQRIVSAANLTHTWESQIGISTGVDYGLGWILNEYAGNRVISHGGNALGYTSSMALLPEAGVGVVMLSNRGYSGLPELAVTRALQLVLGEDKVLNEATQKLADALTESRAALGTQYRQQLDTTIFEPFVGTWTNDALGSLTISIEDGDLIADLGEYRSRLWQYLTSSTEPEATPEPLPEPMYVSVDAPLSGQMVLRFRSEGEQPVILMGVGVVEYVFTAQP